jgi:hypothetical protein
MPNDQFKLILCTQSKLLTIKISFENKSKFTLWFGNLCYENMSVFEGIVDFDKKTVSKVRFREIRHSSIYDDS